jgi:hypothetical protein
MAQPPKLLASRIDSRLYNIQLKGESSMRF